MNNISLTAPINNRSYGLCSVNFLEQLSKSYNVALFPIGEIHTEERFHSLIKKALANAERYDNEAPSLRIFHQFSLAQHIGCGPHIGFPIFELDTFNDTEKHHLNNQDYLIVCSKWASSILKSNDIKPNSSVVPLGFDPTIFFPAQTQRRDSFYRFLNIGKWELRKGHDVIQEAFSKAFTKSDNVELWMSCENPFLTEKQRSEWHSYYKDQSPIGDKIRIIPWANTQKDLAALINIVDCGVFPSRAEGWNLGLLEMMACNKPVITTNYSGHTEFCNNQNAHLIPLRTTELANDGVWFHGQGNWMEFGEPEVDLLVDYMRSCYNRRIKDNPSGVETTKRFMWEESTKKLIKVIEKERDLWNK